MLMLRMPPYLERKILTRYLKKKERNKKGWDHFAKKTGNDEESGKNDSRLATSANGAS